MLDDTNEAARGANPGPVSASSLNRIIHIPANASAPSPWILIEVDAFVTVIDRHGTPVERVSGRSLAPGKDLFYLDGRLYRAHHRYPDGTVALEVAYAPR